MDSATFIYEGERVQNSDQRLISRRIFQDYVHADAIFEFELERAIETRINKLSKTRNAGNKLFFNTKTSFQFKFEII